MATETGLPTTDAPPAGAAPLWRPRPTVPVTIYSFPSMEPLSLEAWSASHLHLPLRRDLLHQAVVYEGDSTRQGTASTKTRWEVAGSRAKIAPQKGRGRARVGDAQSPTRRGGGVVFGPKPRDFSTRLNRKVYDAAWRTALSYRFRRGELLVCADGMELPLPDAFLALAQRGALDRELEDGYVTRFVTEWLGPLGWGRDAGRTTFITADRRPNLFTSLLAAGHHGRALEVGDVDVKDLLKTGRLVVERDALREMIEAHQSDLVSKISFAGIAKPPPPIGEVLVR